MFKRKLRALKYHNLDVNIQDEAQWRNLIVWLEDQKIRLYKIEDRKNLKDICSGNWNGALNQMKPIILVEVKVHLRSSEANMKHLHYVKYLDDLSCETDRSNRNSLCDWLLGTAVRQEYGENVEKFKSMQTEANTSDGTDDPFAHLDVNSPDFKVGLLSLCQLLKIPQHYDPVTSLQAVSILIKERLSEEAQDATLEEGEDFDLKGYEVGFETRDEVLNNASCILRLLHLQELRELQTRINEVIVSVQSITANPKTDQRLGKVGR